jgi:hypothetical protein
MARVPFTDAFRGGLEALGYGEGQTVASEVPVPMLEASGPLSLLPTVVDPDVDVIATALLNRTGPS